MSTTPYAKCRIYSRSIAVAFVATVYGVGSANLILLPVAAKLRGRALRRARRREVILEGVLAIGPGLQTLRGWRPQPAGGVAGVDQRVGLDQLLGWFERGETVSAFP